MAIKAKMDEFISDMKLSIPLFSLSPSKRVNKDETEGKGKDEKMKTRFLEAWNNLRYGLGSGAQLKKDIPIWILGVCHHSRSGSIGSPSDDDDEGVAPLFDTTLAKRVFMDFGSRPWFSYRKNFPPIPGTDFTTDTGWGCMLRTAQMMVAQGLILHFLGRDWRWYRKQSAHERHTHHKILGWFVDDPSEHCPLSIHHLSTTGRRYGNDPGNWYGPNTVAYIMQQAVEDAKQKVSELREIAVYVAQDCTIYTEDVYDLCGWRDDEENGGENRASKSHEIAADSDSLTSSASSEVYVDEIGAEASEASAFFVPFFEGEESLPTSKIINNMIPMTEMVNLEQIYPNVEVEEMCPDDEKMPENLQNGSSVNGTSKSKPNGPKATPKKTKSSPWRPKTKSSMPNTVAYKRQKCESRPSNLPLVEDSRYDGPESVIYSASNEPQTNSANISPELLKPKIKLYKDSENSSQQIPVNGRNSFTKNPSSKGSKIRDMFEGLTSKNPDNRTQSIPAKATNSVNSSERNSRTNLQLNSISSIVQFGTQIPALPTDHSMDDAHRDAKPYAQSGITGGESTNVNSTVTKVSSISDGRKCNDTSSVNLLIGSSLTVDDLSSEARSEPFSSTIKVSSVKAEEPQTPLSSVINNVGTSSDEASQTSKNTSEEIQQAPHTDPTACGQPVICGSGQVEDREVVSSTTNKILSTEDREARSGVSDFSQRPPLPSFDHKRDAHLPDQHEQHPVNISAKSKEARRDVDADKTSPSFSEVSEPNLKDEEIQKSPNAMVAKNYESDSSARSERKKPPPGNEVNGGEPLSKPNQDSSPKHPPIHFNRTFSINNSNFDQYSDVSEAPQEVPSAPEFLSQYVEKVEPASENTDSGSEVHPSSGTGQSGVMPKKTSLKMRQRSSTFDEDMKSGTSSGEVLRVPRRTSTKSSVPPVASSASKAALILVPVRLGESTLNSIYAPCIQAILSLESSIGIIGGKPKHSLFFVGCQGDYLLHLDPHYCQQADTPAGFKKNLHDYHTMSVKKINVKKIDPSCCLGFYCRNAEEFETFKKEGQKLFSPPQQPISYPMCIIMDGRSDDHHPPIELLSPSPTHLNEQELLGNESINSSSMVVVPGPLLETEGSPRKKKKSPSEYFNVDEMSSKLYKLNPFPKLMRQKSSSPSNRRKNPREQEEESLESQFELL